MEMKTVALIAFVGVVAAVGYLFLAAPGIDPAGTHELCLNSVTFNYAEGRAASIGDRWTKDGKEIYEILLAASGNKKATKAICVFDPTNNGFNTMIGQVYLDQWAKP